MIGLSNAGKTTFVSTMYAAMNDGVAEFSVRSARPADHTRLRNSAEQIRRGIFPAPSDRRTVYSLQLWHSANRIVDFNWRDYRGGALVETSDSPQAAQLRADMKDADGLVFVIDSSELLGGLRSRTRLRPVIATAVRLLSECQLVLPVVLVLTKWDLMAARQSEATAAAQTLLGPLIEAVKGANHLLGAMIPVACSPRPQNVELPALWCLHVGIFVRGMMLTQSIQFHESRVRVAERRRGLLDTIISAWRGEQTWEQIRQESLRALGYERGLLEPLIAPSQKLGELFTSTYTF